MTAPPARSRKSRTVVVFVLALVGFDLLVRGLGSTWERYSPDEYAERVAGCAREPRDVVYVGGSPVAEGIDPARVGGFHWRGKELANNYAVGLSGGTTSDIYFGTTHACPTPPKLLIYGMTASDINDSRHEPHGPHSLMTWDDLADWRRTRPEASDWVTRHFLRGRAADLSGIVKHRHGMRMWAAAQADAAFPGQFPESAKEANRQRKLSDDLRTGSGFVPTPWFANRQITQMRASGWVAPPFEYLARYRTGSHLKYLHRLLDWADANGTDVILIDMPTTAELEERHPAEFTEFRARLAEVERTRRVTVIRAGRQATGMDDSHFADLIHMNYLGTEWFSDWLRKELHRLGKEPPSGGPVIARGGDAVIFADKPFFVFLPLVLLGYHLMRSRAWKYSFLLAASWLFYAWASPGYLWVILALTLVDYWVALRIEATDDPRTRKRWLAVSVVSNLGLLAAFKYTVFVFDTGVSLARLFGGDVTDRHWDILLPLGISFHTFQGISYTVDVYRRQIRAVSSLRDYALFVAFFPQLAAGPIVRAVEFLPQMVSVPKVTWARVEDGLRLFVVGLFKKLFIADYLHLLIVDPVFSNPTAYDSATHRWAAVAWAVQIYCDFSGYTDMAVGIAKWFGFDLPPNFHLPYLAVSITDFWRRWHISLSSWLRDYLYFPLGGSRRGAARTYLNLTLLFVLCGLWHGAAWHWLVYGLYNGVLMCLHRAFDRAAGDAAWRKTLWWKCVAWAATSYQLVLGLVLIRMTDWNGGLLILQSLVGIGGSVSVAPPIPLVPVLALMAIGLAGHVFHGAGRAKLPEWVASAMRGLGYAAAVVLLAVVSPGVTKGFIYIVF